MEYIRTCQFYVARKKRNCNMLVKAGQTYCGQHMVVDDSKATHYKRIPCPLDPKHSCFEHRLEHHLAVCNARATDITEEYLRPNCNLQMPEEADIAKVTVTSLSDTQLLSFLDRVQAAHSEHVGAVDVSVLRHDTVLAAEPGVAESSIPGGLRHLAQNSSLLGHLHNVGLLDTSHAHTCYVEFGAGKGQMTHWLAQTVTDRTQAVFVLVDRSPQRYKCDAKMKYNDGLSVHRLRVDIKDLHLPALSDIHDCQRLVAVGKHLCGGATDVALECVSKCQSSGRMALAGAVVALCCHHRCSWPSYVATQFLQEAGFSPEEFYTLTSLTSWATCNPRSEKANRETQDYKENGEPEINQEKKQYANGDRGQEEYNSQMSPLQGDDIKEEKEARNRYTRLGLSAGQREEAGRWAKQLLDEGRARFLRTQGLHARLVQYVDTHTTPENVALIAWKD